MPGARGESVRRRLLRFVAVLYLAGVVVVDVFFGVVVVVGLVAVVAGIGLLGLVAFLATAIAICVFDDFDPATGPGYEIQAGQLAGLILVLSLLWWTWPIRVNL